MFLFVNKITYEVSKIIALLRISKSAPLHYLLVRGNSQRSLICLCAFNLGASAVLVLPALLSLNILVLLFALTAALVFKYPHFKPLLFAVIGFIWLNVNGIKATSESFPSEFEGVDMIVHGDVIGLPTQKNMNYRFRFKIRSVDDVKYNSIVGQSIQLSCYRCSLNFGADQQWSLTVRLKRPHGYASWGAFDYEKYLFRHHLIAKGYVRLKQANHLIDDDVTGPTVWRQNIRQRIQRYADSVGRNMLLALTIGDKSGFSNHQQRVFQNSGVSHLMAISGLHIGLVFMSVTALFKCFLWPFARVYNYFPRPHLLLFPAFAVAFLYAALAGFAVSTQRALIMLAVYLVCRLLSRQLSLFNILVLAASILLLIDPFSVMDIGFWLSCGAVVVISVISSDANAPHSNVNFVTSLLKLQPLLWLGMLPFSVLFFGKLSFVSPLVNLLLVPLFCTVLIPITLLLVMIDVAELSIVSDPLIPLIIQCFDFVFECLEFVVLLPMASGFATPLLWWQWSLFFIIAILSGFKLLKSAIVIIVIFIISILAKPVNNLSKDELQITLLDVGQGLSMVIETADSVLVYDTGPKYSSGFTVADAVLLPYLRRRGVTKIDTLIISHADNDHIGGYDAVKEAFLVERVLTSRVDKIPEADFCEAGQVWQSGVTVFSILGPTKETPQGSNNLSCVLKIEHLGVTVLLTGDIEKRVERFMLSRNRQDLVADIMLVPHQGSKTSSTEMFLDAVSPEVALLAAGYKNHYGHPHPSVLERYQERGINVLSTIESGSVLLKVNSHGWRFIEYRQSEQRFWFD